MTAPARQHGAFTLLETMIVVVLLLAVGAVVLPAILSLGANPKRDGIEAVERVVAAAKGHAVTTGKSVVVMLRSVPAQADSVARTELYYIAIDDALVQAQASDESGAVAKRNVSSETVDEDLPEQDGVDVNQNSSTSDENLESKISLNESTNGSGLNTQEATEVSLDGGAQPPIGRRFESIKDAVARTKANSGESAPTRGGLSETTSQSGTEHHNSQDVKSVKPIQPPVTLPQGWQISTGDNNSADSSDDASMLTGVGSLGVASSSHIGTDESSGVSHRFMVFMPDGSAVLLGAGQLILDETRYVVRVAPWTGLVTLDQVPSTSRGFDASQKASNTQGDSSTKFIDQLTQAEPLEPQSEENEAVKEEGSATHSSDDKEVNKSSDEDKKPTDQRRNTKSSPK